MQGIYKHIDYYGTISIIRQYWFWYKVHIIKIKRHTLGDWINFTVNFRAWKLNKDKEALKEIIKTAVINPIRFKQKDMEDICEKILSMHKSEKKKEDTGEINNNWLTEILAYFWYYCTADKQTVLNLYLDEIQDIIEQINRFIKQDKYINQDLIHDAFSYAYIDAKRDYKKHPKPFWDDYKKQRDDPNKINNSDKLKNFEKMNKDFINKSKGVA